MSDPEERSRRKSFLLLFAVTLALAAAGSFVLWRSSAPPAPVPDGSRPSLFVYAFDNINEDESLDWLRLGLTDMFITDLSRVQGVDVVGMDQVYQILDDLDATEEPVASRRVVEEAGRRAGADTVVLGSFIRSGGQIRINLRVQDSATGEIVTTASVEGEGESALFSMVNELTRHLRETFEAPRTADHLAPPFEELNTASIEAYRYFVEASHLLYQGNSRGALPLFESAADADPDWARALAMVSMMHNNLGHEEQAEQYAQRALALGEKLEPRFRLTIETFYYARREETYGRAIEAGSRLLELHPENNFRHTIARRLMLFERLDEAIPHWEVFRRESRGGLIPRNGISTAYSLQGRLDAGLKVLEEFLAQSPESSGGYRRLGTHLTRSDELDDALEALGRSETLSRNPLGPDLIRWEIFLRREQWDAAVEAVRPRVELQDPTLRWHGLRRLAVLELYRGRSREAVALLDNAIETYEDRRANSAQSRNEKAHVLLARRQPAAALDEATLAQREGHGHYPEWEGLFLVSKAQTHGGSIDDAATTAAKLRQRTESLPTNKELRRHHHLLGEIALARGETDLAIAELERAQAMLLPRGFESGAGLPQHVPIWFSLASAYAEAGRDDAAAELYERITQSASERVWWPVLYVRSFFRLGEIYERRGDSGRARGHFRRFYEHWKDGDLDRDRVETAERRLITMAPPANP